MKKIFLVIVTSLFFASSAFAGKGYTTDTQPATCVDGDFWIDTNGPTGERFYVCEEGSWVKSVGYGTSANPSFNSVHASGGNLAAANAQVTKKWITGLSYTANVTSVIYGGKHYICTSTHTADSTTEPGVGASWATVWSEVVGGSGATALPSWMPSAGPTNGRQILQATGGCSLSAYDNQADCETNSGTWTTPTYYHTSIIEGLINDTGTANDDLWSAAKITSELASKQASLELPSLADAQAGTSTTPYVWSPQRVAQAIAALAPSGSAGEGYYEIDGGSSASITFTGDIDGGASI